MKERPILFSAPMVRAILDGKKTQTRRVVKGMPECKCSSELKHTPKHVAPYFDSYCGEKKTEANPRGMSTVWNWWSRDDRPDPLSEIKCPYGQPGDRLWVREAFTHITGNGIGVHYRADGEPKDRDGSILSTEPGMLRWRPSIHMPRLSSRINLLIKSIRVERLNDISEDDAKAEGVEPFFSTHQSIGRDQTMTTGERISDCEHRASFACLWDDIHGDNSWQQNPWVWVVEFEVMK